MKSLVDAATDELACLLIPSAGGDLLLPVPVVAEIVRGGECALGAEGAPQWAQWVLRWRGIEVPIIDLEALAGRDGVADTRVHVVLNRTRARARAPFMALPATAAPRLVHLAEEDLGTSGATTRPGTAAHVSFGEMGADIPDLARLQDLLAGAAA